MSIAYFSTERYYETIRFSQRFDKKIFKTTKIMTPTEWPIRTKFFCPDLVI